MLSRTLANLLIYLCALVIPGDASPPDIKSVFRSIVLQKVEFHNASQMESFEKIAAIGDKESYNLGDVTVVVLNDVTKAERRIAVSEANITLYALIASTCKKLGWTFVFTEYAVVVGEPTDVSRFQKAFRGEPVNKDRSFVLPWISLRQATMEEVALFFTKKSSELDPEARRTVTCIGAKQSTVNVFGKNVPLTEIMRLIAAAVGHPADRIFRIEKRAQPK